MGRVTACLIFLIGVILLNTLPSQGRLCNTSTGEWVLDTSERIYTESNCQFFDGKSDCQARGRSNTTYQKYEFKTSHCFLKPFSALKLAHILKSKTVLIVGDSVTGNFNQAFLCMANSGSEKLKRWNGKIRGIPTIGFQYASKKFRMLKVSSNYLVDYERLPSQVKKVSKVNVARVDPRWEELAKAADVIIFQSTHWWMSGYHEWYSNGTSLGNISSWEAYAIGIRTVQKYLEQIKFQGKAILLSGSPTHYGLPPGIADEGSFCRTSQLLSYREVLRWEQGRDSLKLLNFQRNLTRGTNLTLIDITTMSLLRPDGRMQNWHVNGGNPAGGRDDCTHWCGAGVLDMWVKVVYNYLRGKIAV